MTFGKHLLAALTLLLTSQFAHAALIEYNGYSRDEASNIVTGGGLEWLMWSETTGLSINSALDSYFGWRLATNVEMAELFNDFLFGSKADWEPDESVYQQHDISWSYLDVDSTSLFIKLFGYTQSSENICESGQLSCFLNSDSLFGSMALFGSDGNNNAGYNLSSVFDDNTFINNSGLEVINNSFVMLDRDNFNTLGSFPIVGVALVRTSEAGIVIPVNAPQTLSLFALALIGLAYQRRRKVTYRQVATISKVT